MELVRHLCCIVPYDEALHLDALCDHLQQQQQQDTLFL
jgi:hypothetical protein